LRRSSARCWSGRTARSISTLADVIAPGVEYYADFGPVTDFYSASEQQQMDRELARVGHVF